MELLILWIFILWHVLLIGGLINFYKTDEILDKITNFDFVDTKIETEKYNPDKDILAIFVGTENNIPPESVMEEIKDTLEDIPECHLLIAPGVFRFVVMKDARKDMPKLQNNECNK